VSLYRRRANFLDQAVRGGWGSISRAAIASMRASSLPLVWAALTTLDSSWDWATARSLTSGTVASHLVEAARRLQEGLMVGDHLNELVGTFVLVGDGFQDGHLPAFGAVEAS